MLTTSKEARAKDIEVGDFQAYLQHNKRSPDCNKLTKVVMSIDNSIVGAEDQSSVCNTLQVNHQVPPQTWTDRIKSIYTVDHTTSLPSIVPYRQVKWEYAIPIIFTPVAHIFVSLIRSYPQHRRKLYYGVGIATFLTIQTRLILMYDAGYPGAEKPNQGGLPSWLKVFLF